MTITEIDFGKIKYDRSHGQSFAETAAYYSDRLMFSTVYLDELRVLDTKDKLVRFIDKNPFV